MSDVLSEATPETDPAGVTPPGDGTAASEGSAGAADTKLVEAERFNGLMSAHQRALTALDEERKARIALEARLQEGTQVAETDSATLAEVQALRAELAESRLAQAKAEALAKYPDAQPFADLIIGSNANEVEQVAAAIATRMAAVKESLGIAPAADDGVLETPAPVVETPAPAPAPAAPVVAGGSVAPGAPTSQSELLGEALREGSWEKFWNSKAEPAAGNLA